MNLVSYHVSGNHGNQCRYQDQLVYIYQSTSVSKVVVFWSMRDSYILHCYTILYSLYYTIYRTLCHIYQLLLRYTYVYSEYSLCASYNHWTSDNKSLFNIYKHFICLCHNLNCVKLQQTKLATRITNSVCAAN